MLPESVDRESSASGVHCQEEYDIHVDGFFFLPLGVTFGHFYLFSNMLLHLLFSSSVSSFMLHLNLRYLVLLHMLDNISLHFLLPLKSALSRCQSAFL